MRVLLLLIGNEYWLSEAFCGN